MSARHSRLSVSTQRAEWIRVECVPRAIADAYRQAVESDHSPEALLRLRRVLLMEAGRVEKRIETAEGIRT